MVVPLILGFVVGLGLLIAILALRPVADVAKRFALSLSTLSYARSFGVGGAYLLVALAVARNPENLGFELESWEWVVIRTLLQGRLEEILVIALLLPLLATLISELAFFLMRAMTKSEPVPFSFVSTHVGLTSEKSTVRRNSGNANVTDEGKTKRFTEQVLVPIQCPPGGLKQIIACFTTQAFTSHFFGYRPYSGLIGPEDSRELAEGRRVVVIAKPADALDFEWMEFRTFQMKRITSSCWILVREPLDRAVARQVIEERLSS